MLEKLSPDLEGNGTQNLWLIVQNGILSFLEIYWNWKLICNTLIVARKKMLKKIKARSTQKNMYLVLISNPYYLKIKMSSAVC